MKNKKSDTWLIMLALLRSVISDCHMPDGFVQALTQEQIEAVYRLASRFDLVHLVALPLSSDEKLKTDNSIEPFIKSMYIAVMRYEQMKYEFERISSEFESEHIPYMPLKGAVMREYYPEPWMRTSCDIDILIHDEMTDQASKCLTQKLRYEQKGKGSHDISLFSPAGVHLELHYDLIEDSVSKSNATVLKNIWNTSHVKGGTFCQHEMTNEMFYFYHIAHMAKHFVHGGCGIKPFIDLFLMRQKFTFDETYRTSLLEQGGIRKFAEQAEELSEVWFDHKPHTDLTKSMEDYILSGGVYGNLENQVAIQQSKKGGKFKYMLSRIWLPLDSLKFRYPILNKHKWLLPVCEVRRWVELLFGNRFKRSRKELEALSSLTDEKTQATKELLSRLEL